MPTTITPVFSTGLNNKLDLEDTWHESEDFARDDNALIVGVYGSGIFAEAEAYHLNALGDIVDKHVLDYGCGTGGTTAQLLALGVRVTGFDIAHLRLAAAQQRTAGAPAHFLQCAAELLPFPDGAFDAVLGKQILHHLDLKVAVPEIARVLRPGERAVFLEPLIHNPILEGYRRLTPHLRKPHRARPEHGAVGLDRRPLQRLEPLRVHPLVDPACVGHYRQWSPRQPGWLAALHAARRPRPAGRPARGRSLLLGEGARPRALISLAHPAWRPQARFLRR